MYRQIALNLIWLLLTRNTRQKQKERKDVINHHRYKENRKHGTNNKIKNRFRFNPTVDPLALISFWNETKSNKRKRENIIFWWHFLHNLYKENNWMSHPVLFYNFSTDILSPGNREEPKNWDLDINKFLICSF